MLFLSQRLYVNGYIIIIWGVSCSKQHFRCYIAAERGGGSLGSIAGGQGPHVRFICFT